MTEHLRIPVTAEQKRIVMEASMSDPSGMAAWARDILLRAATDQLASRKSTTGKRKPTNSEK